MSHPCLTCGACCASYRVDFSIYELDEEGGTVPSGLAVEVNGSTCRMRGTDHVPIRCAALTGKVGERWRVAFTSGALPPAMSCRQATTAAKRPVPGTDCPPMPRWWATGSSEGDR